MSDRRLSGRIRALEQCRVGGARPLRPWRVGHGRTRPVTLPFRWRRADQPVWFHHTLRLDDDLRGHALLLQLDVAEGLLFVDGEPYHGLDRQHREVVLPATLTRTDRLELAIEASRAAPFGGAWFRDARVGLYDEGAERLAHGLTALERLCDELRPGRDRRVVTEVLEEIDDLLGQGPVLAIGRPTRRRRGLVPRTASNSWSGQQRRRARQAVASSTWWAIPTSTSCGCGRWPRPAASAHGRSPRCCG